MIRSCGVVENLNLGAALRRRLRPHKQLLRDRIAQVILATVITNIRRDTLDDYGAVAAL